MPSFTLGNRAQERTNSSLCIIGKTVLGSSKQDAHSSSIRARRRGKGSPAEGQKKVKVPPGVGAEECLRESWVLKDILKGRKDLNSQRKGVGMSHSKSGQ